MDIQSQYSPIVYSFFYFASFLCPVWITEKKNFHFLSFSIYYMAYFSRISMDTPLLAFVRTFFTGLGITITTLTVECEWDNIDIRVITPDSALLIGMHGKSIESIQHLLSRLLEKKFENFVHVHLEINDYMKQKDERLYQFLDSKIALVRSTGKEVQIPGLTSYDRKKAHGYISGKAIEWLSTRSEGEGSSRVMTLSYTGPIIANKVSRPNMTHVVNTRVTWMSLPDDGVGI